MAEDLFPFFVPATLDRSREGPFAYGDIGPNPSIFNYFGFHVSGKL